MAEPGKPPFKLGAVQDYQILAEELDLAWARLTDGERAHVDDEAKRRRDKNPLWPWVTSDHVDRLSEKLHRNTTATTNLECALSDPEWGLVFKVRALTSSSDTLRDAVTELNASIVRLCTALEAHAGTVA